jgi:hypothetical protein
MIRPATVDEAARLTGRWRPASLRFGADLAGREVGFGRGGWPGAGGGGRSPMIPNDPGVSAPAPASAPHGWRDVLPELSADHLLVGWDQGPRALALLGAR